MLDIILPVPYSDRPFHCRPQAVPALLFRLLTVTGPPVLRRFSPATAATYHVFLLPLRHLPAARGGTDRLIRECWGERNLGASKRTCAPCIWESIRAVSIEIRLVCSVAVEVDSVSGRMGPHSDRTGRR
jgi:hypothetical protein